MSQTIARSLGLLLLAQLSAATAQVALPSAEAIRRSESAFELVSGVVVDPAGDVLFLMTPNGGVDALSVSSGALSWSSDKAAKPLALYGDLLLAQAESGVATEQLEVVMLDARRGSRMGTLSMPLPGGVSARIDDGMGLSFVARAVVRGGVPLVSWHATQRRTKGTAPRPGEAMERRQEAFFRLDPQASLFVPVASSVALEARAALPRPVQSWSDSGVAAQTPTRVGEILAGTQVLGGSSSPAGRIVLKRWLADGGAPLADIELLRGPHILQFRSTDGRHLLISERAAPGDAEEYEWSIFALDTGERVGQLRNRRSHAPFVVSGASVLFVAPAFGHRVNDEWIDVPRRLRAVVLGSGAQVWERPLRDPTYRGPYRR